MRSVLDMRLGSLGAAGPAAVAADDHADSPVCQRSEDDMLYGACPELDVFGIRIPLRASDVPRESSPVGDGMSYSDDAPATPPDCGRFCSVVLAESPSRLDLSALLC